MFGKKRIMTTNERAITEVPTIVDLQKAMKDYHLSKYHQGLLAGYADRYLLDELGENPALLTEKDRREYFRIKANCFGIIYNSRPFTPTIDSGYARGFELATVHISVQSTLGLVKL